jgi:hypothetical protein
MDTQFVDQETLAGDPFEARSQACTTAVILDALSQCGTDDALTTDQTDV